MTQSRPKIAIVGNDYGAAVYLDSVLPRLSEMYSLLLLASGPAFDLWKKGHGIEIMAASEYAEPAVKKALSAFSPSLLITGTSHYCELERISWGIAHDFRIPSLAVVDAWVNFPERFIRQTDNAIVSPSAVATIDIDSRDTLKAFLGKNVRIHITGHPHLEGVVLRHKIRPRRSLQTKTTRVSFFSNPITEDHQVFGTHKDQFYAAEALLSACVVSPAPLELRIKPHPREERQRWDIWVKSHQQKFTEVWITLSDDSSEKIIEESDVVCGITSMALVEAALMGKTVYSIQLNRDIQINPIFELIDNLVVSSIEEKIPRDFVNILSQLKYSSLPNNFAEKFDNSTNRFFHSIEAELSLK